MGTQPLATTAKPFTTTTLKWGALVDSPTPADWVEGKDYDREAPINVNSLVGIRRTDGTIKFGQVVKKAGFFYQDAWEVVVTMNADGTPAATRVEEGVLLIRPKPASMEPVLSAAPKITVNEKDISETKGDKGFFGNMFGTPTFEGGSAPSAAPPAGVPKAAPPAAPAKAVVPAGIIPGGPKAAAPPAPPAPPVTVLCYSSYKFLSAGLLLPCSRLLLSSVLRSFLLLGAVCL